MTSSTLTPVSWFGAVRLALLLMLLCGGAYPLVTTQLGKTLFPWQATGSLIHRDGVAVGSRLVAQPFSAPAYFEGRPSAADQDPTGVSGSNLAPSNPELSDRVRVDGERIAARENTTRENVPVDLVTASGSGIDPHISRASARLQAARVAQARQLTQAQVETLIDQHVEGPFLGLLGPSYVNVLQLNLALDNGEANAL